MLFGLIGYPISQSFSRPYFTEKFARLGLAATYEYRNFELADLTLFPEIIANHPELRGLNVTAPHKQAVLEYLDELDPAAAAIGAVNTILVQHGRTKGFNTDVIGFREDFVDFTDLRSSKAKQLKARFKKGRIELGDYPGSPADELSTRRPLDYRALVLGTGGASLAVGEALQQLDIPYSLVSRTAGPGKLSYEQLSADVLGVHRFIINTTPLGMAYQADRCPDLPYNFLGEKHYCYDLVYHPAETLFLRKAARSGARTRSGIGMLYGQAEAAWDIWCLR